MTTFHTRASGRINPSTQGRPFPRGFARLQWQLFIRRLEAAKTVLAVRRVRPPGVL